MQSSTDDLVSLSRARRLPNPQMRKAIRRGAGLTQDDVAGALGITRAAVTRYESGTREPRGELRTAYARLLDRLLRDAVR